MDYLTVVNGQIQRQSLALVDQQFANEVQTAGDVAIAIADHASAADPHPGYVNQSELSAAIATCQPADSELSTLAALTSTALGQSLLTAASSAAVRALIGCKVQVLLVDNTPRSHTGTTVETSLLQHTIPGGTLKNNSLLWLLATVTATPNTNLKQLPIKIAGTTLFNQGRSDTNVGAEFYRMMKVRNNQILYGSSATANLTTFLALNADLSQDQTLEATAILANATDTITLESIALIVIGGD